MFKRKIISGTIDATTKENIKIYSVPETTWKYTSLATVANNFGNSVLELLNSCGVKDCKYDPANKWLYVLGVPLTIAVSSRGLLNVYSPVEIRSINKDTSNPDSSDGIQILNKVTVDYNYNFSVTFVGDPSSAFSLVITADNAKYTTYTDGYQTLEFFHMTEQMVPNNVIGIRRNNSMTVAVYKVNPEGSAEDMTEVETYFNYDDNSIDYLPLTDYGNSSKSKITSLYPQEKLLLVPLYTDSFLFKAKDCFIWNGIFSQVPDKKSFNPLSPIIVVIGGENYMVYNNEQPFILKLTTKE